MATTNELENWLRHVEDQLEKLGKGDVKKYTRFHGPTLEGKDNEGKPRQFTESGVPIRNPGEGHGRQE